VSEKIRPVELLTCPEGQDRSDGGSAGSAKASGEGIFLVLREGGKLRTLLVLKRLNTGYYRCDSRWAGMRWQPI
jgi:hypothetical protein